MSIPKELADKLKADLFVRITGLKVKQKDLFMESEGKIKAPKELWGTYASGSIKHKSRTVIITKDGQVWLCGAAYRQIPEPGKLAPHGLMSQQSAKIWLYLDIENDDLAKRIRDSIQPGPP